MNILKGHFSSLNDIKYIKMPLCQGEWTRNSRFVAPNLRGAIAPSWFGCDESTCFASILRLKMHSDMQLALLFLLLIQMHRRVPRSSSPVWLISEVKDVFVTVEHSFKYMWRCKYYDVHLGNHIICKKNITNRYIYLHNHGKYETNHWNQHKHSVPLIVISWP